MSNALEVNIIETTIVGVDKSFCTFIPEEDVFKHGLISSVIIGEVTRSESGAIDFDNGFKGNALFKKTIFNFIENILSNDPSLIVAAKEQKQDWLYIIDQRTPTPDGEVPSHDIMGAFEVVDGALANFDANQNYRLRSENGFTNFGEELNIKMKSFLKELLINNA